VLIAVNHTKLTNQHAAYISADLAQLNRIEPCT